MRDRDRFREREWENNRDRENPYIRDRDMRDRDRDRDRDKDRSQRGKEQDDHREKGDVKDKTKEVEAIKVVYQLQYLFQIFLMKHDLFLYCVTWTVTLNLTQLAWQ